MTDNTTCPVFRPDHNGECLNCDEWMDAHTRGAIVAGAARDQVQELTGKIQCLIDWADEQGLLEEHCFTFPDGDTWKATTKPDHRGR